MAEYALLNRITRDRISPEEALDERSHGVFRDYYCPNPECNAVLAPVKSDDNKHPNPFFRALRTKSHIEGCNFKAYYDEDAALNAARQRNSGLMESDFSIEVLLEKMKAYIPPEPTDSTSPASPRRSIQDEEKTAKEKILSNTTKLFHYCGQHDITDKLGEKAIKEILIDDRTLFDTYRHYIKEGVYLLDLPLFLANYDPKTGKLYLKIRKQFLGNISINYLFALQFPSYESLMKTVNEVFDYRETRSRLIVLASITKNYGDDSRYFCEIFNDAQLYFKKSEELIKDQS